MHNTLPQYSTRRLPHRPGELANGVSQVPTLPAETFSLRIKIMSAFLFQILVVKATLKRSLVLKLLMLEETLSDNGCAAIPRGTREKNAPLVRSGGSAVGQGVGWIEEVRLSPHSLLNIGKCSRKSLSSS